VRSLLYINWERLYRVRGLGESRPWVTSLRGFIYGQRHHSSTCQTDKRAVVSNLSMPKKPRQRGESVISKSLVDERFLPLKSLDGTARREIVILIESSLDDLRKLCCAEIYVA
jgi:hypothetical protein